MKLDSVQFIHVVNHHGQHLQGASNVSVGDRPGQPPFDLEIVEGAVMPCVRLQRLNDGRTATLVPMTNVASYRESPKATPATQTTQKAK